MRILLTILYIFYFQPLFSQTIGTFVSVPPANQTQLLVIPNSHRFQRIIKSGDAITGGTGILPANLDFTGYVPILGSSTNGYISLNHETNPGAATILDVNFNLGTNLWATTTKNNVNLAAVYTTSTNCSGGITPWGTVLSGEETTATTDGNMDGYFDNGWLMEINPATRTATRKLWAAGRCRHENAAIKNNGTLLYTGADESVQGFLYKFVFTTANDPTAGLLYALQKTGTTGTWLPVANTTQTERNTTGNLAATAGATNFNGIEDVEIGPNGQIYFASKGSGEVFKFTDNGTSIADFITFVGGGSTNYNINSSAGIVSENWGFGNDNLAFDGDGNLWVLQDGGKNIIWLVKPAHTQAMPQVEVFGNTPEGSEPTGITFTPDFKYMFISFQHPNSTNTAVQIDAAGNNVIWNTHTSIVIANATNLGNSTLGLSPIILNGQFLNNAHNLNWSAINPINIRKIFIEQSHDGFSFLPIQEFNNTTAPLNNAFIANQLLVGNNYYRIKLINNTNQITYSNILKLINPIINNIKVETLGLNRFNIKFLHPNQVATSIKILNNEGKILRSQIITLVNNYNLNLSTYPRGQYYLKISNPYLSETIKILLF
jgi:hypothetical protein